MPSNFFLVIIAAFWTFWAGNAAAEPFIYQPGMNITLGKTWNPGSPNDVGGLGECLIPIISNSEPVGSEQYTEGFVDKYETLQSDLKLNYSGNGSARYGIAKVSSSAQFSALREAFRDDKKIVYIVTGRRTYAPVALTGISLSDAGKEAASKASQDADRTQFYNFCGQTLITSVTKATSVSLVYTFTASNSSLKNQIRASISNAASAGPNAGSTSLNIMSEVRKADSNVQVNLEVIQSGFVDNTASVRTLVGLEPGAISEVRGGLRKILSEISWKTAAITSFTADRLDAHMNVPKGTDLDYALLAYGKIDNMRSYADEIVIRHFQLRDVLDDTALGFISLKPGAESEILLELASIDDKLENLVSTARKCLKSEAGGTCSFPYIPVSKGVLKFINVSYGQFAGWRGQVSGNHYDGNQERVMYQNTYWPEFTLTNARYIRSARLMTGVTLVAALDSGQIAAATSVGVLSFKPFFSINQTGFDYCWKRDWGPVCNPRAADVKALLNKQKIADSNSYILKITDIEGGVTDIPASLLKDTNF